MKQDTYGSAIAANAVLEELLAHLVSANVLDRRLTVGKIVFAAARKLNETKDPAFEAAAKAVLALYKR